MRRQLHLRYTPELAKIVKFQAERALRAPFVREMGWPFEKLTFIQSVGAARVALAMQREIGRLSDERELLGMIVGEAIAQRTSSSARSWSRFDELVHWWRTEFGQAERDAADIEAA